MKTQIISKDNLQNKVLKELESFKELLKEKDVEIYNLKEQLEYIRNQHHNENMYQMKSLFKDFEFFNKFNGVNTQKQASKVNKYYNFNLPQPNHVNRESISSVATMSTTTTNINPNLTYDYEKLQRDKANLEAQLVTYKLKYAENSSKIFELDDEKENLKKKMADLNEKLTNREEIIKNLINERDSLKYSNFNLARKSIKTDRGNLDYGKYTTSSTPQSPERNYMLKKSNSKANIENLYIQTEFNNPYNYLNTDVSPSPRNKTPNSFVKILKNIFVSDNKRIDKVENK